MLRVDAKAPALAGIRTFGSSSPHQRRLSLVAESFKFVRLFPLNQSDVPPQHVGALADVPADINTLNPSLDYTPPQFITLLFTELGAFVAMGIRPHRAPDTLPPSALSIRP
jgi:translation initiation factor 2B subunit (eIF-2B alpha/beta/delta family)